MRSIRSRLERLELQEQNRPKAPAPVVLPEWITVLIQQAYQSGQAPAAVVSRYLGMGPRELRARLEQKLA